MGQKESPTPEHLVSEDPAIRALRTLIQQFDELDMSAYDNATLEKVADMAGELAGQILAERNASKAAAELLMPAKLHLVVEEYPEGSRCYSYLRDSNDDRYSGPFAEPAMVEWVAESEKWAAKMA